jgi:hypothetical protein
LSAFFSRIGTPLTWVMRRATNTGEMSVTPCHPCGTGRTMIATPIQRTISPK